MLFIGVNRFQEAKLSLVMCYNAEHKFIKSTKMFKTFRIIWIPILNFENVLIN
jgi:hypothetical protein